LIFGAVRGAALRVAGLRYSQKASAFVPESAAFEGFLRH
jgi:hypothetical protein